MNWFGPRVFILCCFTMAGVALAIPAKAAGNPDDTPLVMASTRDELLLFWDERDLYVWTATRIDKPLAHVAENMTIVTAREIERMNAHTVSEVLNRVPGLFVDFGTMDFGSPAQLSTQGSEYRHVTVLLNGVVWNVLGGDNVQTITIPVRIVERIEIVKGPASSAWGSALGGVINIITKRTGDTESPRGEVNVSHGEAHSLDDNADVYGQAGPLGYYLFAGHQQSDGLKNNRGYKNDSLYGKFSAAPVRDLDLRFTIGYSHPDFDFEDLADFDIKTKSGFTAFHATASADYRISPELHARTAVYFFRQRFSQLNYFLASGDLFKNFDNDEQTVAGSLMLTYAAGMHRAALGAETSHGEWEQTIAAGPLYQALGVSEHTTNRAGIDKWALFANDTVSFGKFATTPGIRYDHDNIGGSFVSPSLGATYELGKHAVARASVARGFSAPPLLYTTGGGIFLVPNPAVSAESVMSYQAGLESGIADLLNVKATLFRHDSTDEMIIEPIPNNYPYKTVNNKGDVTRQGYELETESLPIYNVSLKASHAYVHKKADSLPEATTIYSFLLGIRYDDRQSLLAQLAGTYIWWDLPADRQAKYDAFVWDLNLSKKLRASEKTSVEAFMTVHNLFNASYYTVWVYPNPDRWVEAGLRLKF